MESQKRIRGDIDKLITADNVLFFDLDGTLVDTNLANFLSYKKAIESITKSDHCLKFDPDNRFNRSRLKKVVPNLNESDCERIIKEKEKYYNDFIQETNLYIDVVNILSTYSKTNRTVLVTNCRKDRALITLKFHNLTDKFNDVFYRQISDSETRINKYINAISSLSISAQTVIVFEDDKNEIEDAKLAGIPIINILNI